MAGHVVNNFIKNGIATFVSCNDNLWRGTTQLLFDNAGTYLSYPLREAKRFILSFNVEIKEYKLQQVDIVIFFRLYMWMHLVIRTCLLHLEPL